MKSNDVSRRDFLRGATAGAACLAGLPIARAADVPAGDITRLSEHLWVYRGPINVGIIRDGDKALLIDCGDGSVSAALKKQGVTAIDRILFTHHHRDQACGAHALAAAGAKLSVPADERQHFDAVADYWSNPKSRWHIYNAHPHHLMLAEPVPVDAVVADCQTITWGPAKISVLSTPGHTDGSVSYLVEVDGKRVVFSGDVIYDEGQVWDIHAMQKGFQRGKRRISDYHGFLGSWPEVKESLARIKQAKPELLVPSHGKVMSNPTKAADSLVARLDAYYERYVAISALRHYFPELFTEFEGKPSQMPIRPGIEPPDCLRHMGTTWMLVSRDKAAFPMDCGSPRVVKWIQGLQEKGEIKKVEGLWVTHYHDDHVNAIPEFQKAFDCPCITDSHVAQIISKPMAWRLPCISPSVARVDRATKNGETWQWREFKMTAYHFPGQTFYHGALLVEGQGKKMLFVGDSHTAGGIDDYCSHNRNWLGDGVGFDRCIALIEKLKPTHIFNCHVADAFTFTPEECRFMRENLAWREEAFGQIVPWDQANYGMDEPWVRCFPYEQKAAVGGNVTLDVVVTNHSAAARKATCRAVLPRAWGGKTTAWASVDIPAKTEGQVKLSLKVPTGVQPGRYVVPIDLKYDKWDLPQFSEAVVVVG